MLSCWLEMVSVKTSMMGVSIVWRINFSLSVLNLFGKIIFLIVVSVKTTDAKAKCSNVEKVT